MDNEVKVAFGIRGLQWFLTFFDSRKPFLTREQFGGIPSYNLPINRCKVEKFIPRAFQGTPVENHWSTVSPKFDWMIGTNRYIKTEKVLFFLHYCHLLQLLCFLQTGRSFLEQLRVFFHEILLSAFHLKPKKTYL